MRAADVAEGRHRAASNPEQQHRGQQSILHRGLFLQSVLLPPWPRPHGDVSGSVQSGERKAALIAGQREKPAMASLRQEHRYGLSCGKNNRNCPSRTLYHVKLTDTAIKALEAYQNLKTAVVATGFTPSSTSSCTSSLTSYQPQRGTSAMASHSGAEEARTKDGLFSEGHYSGCRGCGNNRLHEIYTQTPHSTKS
ncbi:hypothetical protein INR49_016291 [Caranx melampygus]|nr:hypothetical protein INR49_016291 [Caranx melampygus]